jgi:hypothetical protein
MRAKTFGLLVTAAVVSSIAGRGEAQTAGIPRLQDFQAKGSFELVVTKSEVLKPGASRINAVSAFAVRNRDIRLSVADAIVVTFFTTPIAVADIDDIVKNDARRLKSGDHAVLVLMMDDARRLSQANLTVSVPGKTIVRTVSWKPDDLAKAFPSFSFDGTRLRLKTAGTYRESDAEAFSMSWAADVDLPLIRNVQK